MTTEPADPGHDDPGQTPPCPTPRRIPVMTCWKAR